MECLSNHSVGLALILSITDSLSVMEGTPQALGTPAAPFAVSPCASLHSWLTLITYSSEPGPFS